MKIKGAYDICQIIRIECCSSTTQTSLLKIISGDVGIGLALDCGLIWTVSGTERVGDEESVSDNGLGDPIVAF